MNIDFTELSDDQIIDYIDNIKFQKLSNRAERTKPILFKSNIIDIYGKPLYSDIAIYSQFNTSYSQFYVLIWDKFGGTSELNTKVINSENIKNLFDKFKVICNKQELCEIVRYFAKIDKLTPFL